MTTLTSTTPRRGPVSRVLGSPLVDLLLGPHGVDRYLELIRPSLTVNDARAEVALQAVAFDLLEDESTRVISIRRTLRRDQSEPNRTGLAIDKIGIDLVVVEGW